MNALHVGYGQFHIYQNPAKNQKPDRDGLIPLRMLDVLGCGWMLTARGMEALLKEQGCLSPFSMN